MALMRASRAVQILVVVVVLATPACSRNRGKVLAGALRQPTNPVIVGTSVYVDTVVDGPVSVGGRFPQEHFRVEVPLNGGPPRTAPLGYPLAPDIAAEISAFSRWDVKATVQDGSDLYVGTSFYGDGRAGADSEHPAGMVARIHLPGGAPVVLASGQSVGGLALDATGIYWVNGCPDGSSQVVRLSRAGGALVVLASREHYRNFLTLDEARIYWASSGGTIRSIAKGGGRVSTLTSFEGQITGLAVGPDVVVWTILSMGVVEKRDMGMILPGVLMAVPK